MRKTRRLPYEVSLDLCGSFDIAIHGFYIELRSHYGYARIHTACYTCPAPNRFRDAVPSPCGDGCFRRFGDAENPYVLTQREFIFPDESAEDYELQFYTRRTLVITATHAHAKWFIRSLGTYLRTVIKGLSHGVFFHLKPAGKRGNMSIIGYETLTCSREYQRHLYRPGYVYPMQELVPPTMPLPKYRPNPYTGKRLHGKQAKPRVYTYTPLERLRRQKRREESQRMYEKRTSRDAGTNN